jgi:broad specificity phosphatase PhoE
MLARFSLLDGESELDRKRKKRKRKKRREKKKSFRSAFLDRLTAFLEELRLHFKLGLTLSRPFFFFAILLFSAHHLIRALLFTISFHRLFHHHSFRCANTNRSTVSWASKCRQTTRTSKTAMCSPSTSSTSPLASRPPSRPSTRSLSGRFPRRFQRAPSACCCLNWMVCARTVVLWKCL